MQTQNLAQKRNLKKYGILNSIFTSKIPMLRIAYGSTPSRLTPIGVILSVAKRNRTAKQRQRRNLSGSSLRMTVFDGSSVLLITHS